MLTDSWPVAEFQADSRLIAGAKNSQQRPGRHRFLKQFLQCESGEILVESESPGNEESCGSV